ncbi:shikimate kinase, partial [Desulfobacterales bacterium HSG17]|nr:shikimate kinase [Desulfobacterales bacterium HSG17]
NRIVQDMKTIEQRPALTDKDLMEEIKETLAFRNPLYENAANFSIDTEQSGIDEICKKIIKRL